MTTIAQSRMSKEQAEQALARVEQQITTHADVCEQCRAARHGVVLAIWKSCPQGLELFRVQMSLQHRLNFLALKARRATTRVEQVW
jgi:hypothetical protein